MTPEFFKISEPPSWRAVAGVCYNCTAEPRLELLGSSFEIKSEAPRNCYRYDTTWRGFMGPKNRYHPTTGTVLRAFFNSMERISTDRGSSCDPLIRFLRQSTQATGIRAPGPPTSLAR